MDKLTKSQKDEFATAFAILALHDGGVSNRKSFRFIDVAVVSFAFLDEPIEVEAVFKKEKSLLENCLLLLLTHS